jgi:hypothetical protein
MQKQILKILAPVFICLVTGVFFYQTIVFGKLPVPSDTLVGLYHPFRDMLSPQYPNGIPFKNFLITDPVRQQIPWRKTVIDSYKIRTFPLWDAYPFSGTPLLANIQSGALYPLNILFFIFPFAVAWTLLIISQPLLSALFLYLFLRNKKLEIIPSLSGSVCFAFSGFSIAWLTWGTIGSAWAWTPLSLLAVDKLHDSGTVHKIFWRIVFILSVAGSLFAGHLQVFFYSIILISLYGIWPYIGKKISGIPLTHIGIVAGISVVTFPLWFFLFQWLPGTSRLTQGAAWTHEGFFIPFQHLIQFIIPDFFGNPATLNYWGTWNYGEMTGYIGVAGLIVAALGAGPSTWLWVFVIAGSLLFAVASPLSVIPYQLHIPVISTLQPTRLLVLVDFALSVLAAYGVSRVMKGIQKRSVIMVFGIITVFFGIAWASVLLPKYFSIDPVNAAVAKRNILLPAVIFCISFLLLMLCTVKNKMVNRFRLLIITVLMAVVIFDLFRFGWKFTPFTDSKYFFPTTSLITYLQNQKPPFRIMATDDRIFPPNVNEYYGIESVGGYDPVHDGRYEEFIAAMERGKPDIQPPFGFDRIIAPKNIQSPLMLLLNVRYILSFDELKDSAIYKKVFEEGNTKVYEYQKFIPRVYVASDIIYADNKQEVINQLFKSSFYPGSTAVVESPINILTIPLSTNESASIRSYTGEYLNIDVRVEVPRLLVINNIYNNGWNVTVNNKPSSLIRVNYLFMGVVLEPGSHLVTLHYY